MSTQTSIADLIPLILTIGGFPVALFIGVRLAIAIVKMVADMFSGPPPPEGIERVKINRSQAAVQTFVLTLIVFAFLGLSGFVVAAAGSGLQSPPDPMAFILLVAISYIVFQHFIAVCAIQVIEAHHKKSLQTKGVVSEQAN